MANLSSTGTTVVAVGCVLGACGLGLGWYTAQSLTPPMLDTAIPAQKADVPLVEKSVRTMEVLRSPRKLAPVPQNGDPGRYRDCYLFFAPELWEMVSDEKKANLAVDIYEKGSPEIHPSVPNTWFVDNGLKDILGRADALALDSDHDGFSNAEEFANGTLPNDPSSHPSLVADGACKVFVSQIQRTHMQIVASSLMAFDENPVSVRFTLYSGNGFPDTPAAKTKDVEAGARFGLPQAPERFVLEGFEKRPFAGMGGDLEQENVAKVKDTQAVGNPVYYIRAGRSKKGDKLFGTDQEKGKYITDTRVTFVTTAGAAAQEGGGGFSVMLRERFTIPGNGDAKFLLDSVNDDGSAVIIEENSKDGRRGVPIAIPALKSE
ncbi:MAG: thrombospondin type 3 repeat-containing protein [Akkermansiaceae bacterium]|nr:thrombospondin type 3 repeat-containing protein [Akkermansiaceae bacterium]